MKLTRKALKEIIKEVISENDGGDCDLGRTIPQHPKYPNGRILVK